MGNAPHAHYRAHQPLPRDLGRCLEPWTCGTRFGFGGDFRPYSQQVTKLC